jgi:hypothetical protein
MIFVDNSSKVFWLLIGIHRAEDESGPVTQGDE